MMATIRWMMLLKAMAIVVEVAAEEFAEFVMAPGVAGDDDRCLAEYERRQTACRRTPEWADGLRHQHERTALADRDELVEADLTEP